MNRIPAHQLPCLTTAKEQEPIALAVYANELAKIISQIDFETAPQMSQEEYRNTWGNEEWRDRWLQQELDRITNSNN